MTQKGNPSEGQEKKKSIPPNPKGKKVVKPSKATKEMDANEEERMEHFEEVDYSEHFITNETFKSKEELRDWAKSRAQAHNMFIIVGTTHQRSIWLQCERSGKYRTTKLNIDVKSRKLSGSKKCLCPFSLKGWEESKGVWRLCVMNGKHNHNPGVYHHGRSLAARLSQKQYEITAKLTKSDMKPKEILDYLKLEDPNVTTTLKHIYNARNKIKVEAKGGRTIVQPLLHCIQYNELGYTHWQRVDAITNEVIDAMFAYSRSIQLLRLFPYVLLIESTLKTDRYKRTLLEIIGVTPVGKNFNVAFAFIKNESEESYRWALMNLRSLFQENVRPNVIVTDRELELMKAVELIFPESYHLLCLLDINRDVESNAIKLIGANEEITLILLQQKWKKLVNSRSVEEYEANYSDITDILWQYQADQAMLKYLEETWLIFKEKFVRAWTDKVFHIGNTTIKRVENVHYILETCLSSAMGGFDSLWTHVHSKVERHINDIEVDLARSRRIVKHVISHCCLKNLAGYVTNEALNKLYQERKLGRNSKVGTDPQLCGCYLRSSHGLPCTHEIALKEQENGMFFTDDVHVFWRTLCLPPISDVPDDEAVTRAGFISVFEELRQRPLKEKVAILHAVDSFLRLEQIGLDKPPVMQPTSCQKNNSVCGHPSPLEYMISSTGRLSSRSQSDHGHLSPGSPIGHDYSSSGSVGRDLAGRGCCSSGQGHGKSSSSFAPAKYSTEFPPFSNELPSFLVPYITSWLNVAGDGNCGYRVIADIIYGSEDKWMDVRKDLYLEIFDRVELYERIFGSRNAIGTVLCSLCHWEKGIAPKNTWMTLLDMGLAIATRYNAVVLELSATQNVTYFPLCDDGGTGQISCFIPICYLPADEHYVLLNLMDHCPLPPFYQQWSRFRDNSVAYLDDAFTARRNFWDFLQAHG